eukprot:gene11871-13835_t
MRKLTSRNLENEMAINAGCGMAHTLNLIGGRWKPSILWRLVKETLRYSELKALLPAISERILVLQLRELEKDGLIFRKVYPEVPPKVEYSLTALGESLKTVLQVLAEWGDEHREDDGTLLHEQTAQL